MTLPERARALAVQLPDMVCADISLVEGDAKIWLPDAEAAILAALEETRREAIEEAAHLMLTKAGDNDSEAKAAKMPVGSGSHLAANVYRNAEFRY